MSKFYKVQELRYSIENCKNLLIDLKTSLIHYFVDIVHENEKEADFWFNSFEKIMNGEEDNYLNYCIKNLNEIIGVVLIRKIKENHVLFRHIYIVNSVNREEVAFFLLKKVIEKISVKLGSVRFDNFAFTFPEDYLTKPLERLGFSVLKRYNMVINLCQNKLNHDILPKFSIVPFEEIYLPEIANISVIIYKNHPDSRFWEEINSVPSYLQYLEKSLSTYCLKECSFIALNKRNQIIGFCLTEKGNEEGEFIIQNVATTKKYRRLGIAKSLISRVVKEAYNLKYEKAILTVTDKNPAQNLYKSLGFKIYNSFNVIINS